MRALRNLTFACLIATPVLADPIKLVALGDSLTQGYGLPPEDGFVPQLEAWLRASGQDVTVINAGVSGDTTAGGLARLNWTLTPDVAAMIVTLGGNDILRGIDPANSRANLEKIVKTVTDRHLPLLLVGFQAPSNFGPDYKTAFDTIYPDLSQKYGTLLTESFFAPLVAEAKDRADVLQYFQPDGLHPNKEGVAKIVAGLGPQVLDLLAQVKP